MKPADGLVPKNLTVARRLYAAAAGHGMKEAQARLDALGPDRRRHRRPRPGHRPPTQPERRAP